MRGRGGMRIIYSYAVFKAACIKSIEVDFTGDFSTEGAKMWFDEGEDSYECIFSHS